MKFKEALGLGMYAALGIFSTFVGNLSGSFLGLPRRRFCPKGFDLTSEVTFRTPHLYNSPTECLHNHALIPSWKLEKNMIQGSTYKVGKLLSAIITAIGSIN